MSLLIDTETNPSYEVVLNDRNKKQVRLSRKEARKKRYYPVLIVENLPKGFGNIEKSDDKKPLKISKCEAVLLTLIARIAVEIFIKEEL